MRAEQTAALTNFLLILVIAVAAVMGTGPSGAHVYSNPTKAVFQAIALAVLVGAPFAVVASWRTWVHAERLLNRHTTGLKGVFEAAVLGFALTLPFVLPGIVVRQFNPGPWGQPQAFFLGIGYVGVYGLLGLIVGFVAGLLLWAAARLALFVHRRVAAAP
jgi:hypothetical protein